MKLASTSSSPRTNWSVRDAPMRCRSSSLSARCRRLASSPTGTSRALRRNPATCYAGPRIWVASPVARVGRNQPKIGGLAWCRRFLHFRLRPKRPRQRSSWRGLLRLAVALVSAKVGNLPCSPPELSGLRGPVERKPGGASFTSGASPFALLRHYRKAFAAGPSRTQCCRRRR